MSVLELAEQEVRKSHEFLKQATAAEGRGDMQGANDLRDAARNAFQRGDMGTCYFTVLFKYGFFGEGQGRGDVRWYHIRPRTGQIIHMNSDNNLATNIYVQEITARIGRAPTWPRVEDGDYYTKFQQSPVKNMVTDTVHLPSEQDPDGAEGSRRPRLLLQGEKLPPRRRIMIPYKLPDGTVMVPENGDIFLACCDGLHDFLPWVEFQQIAFADISLEEKVRRFGDRSIAAMGRAGKDNITMAAWQV